jgi:anthranilate/para-aminobenzoate synthase component I
VLNPAPFACLLALPDATLVGSSPERFLKVGAEGWVESRPIKGTRPRGANPDEDRRLRAALAASAKDRAENLMIVDLVRNDLGRVCEIGSVHVPELFAIEPYQTVFQLVSTVRGRLARGADALDAVQAAFPPGSMTGAPKLAAMELLARLEPGPRGLYSGAVGYLDLRGGCDLAVTIRSIVLHGGRAFVHTGGGIVADSDSRAEWCEAEDKARALVAALRRVAP